MSTASAGNAGATPPETLSGMVISLLFWLSVLVATALFAAVGLSPKLIEQLQLRDEFAANQLHLVQVEQQNEQLEQVVNAIRQDKEFAAEMTRIEFDAVRRDEEIIPVESELRLSPRDIGIPHAPAVMPRAWYRPLLVPFAENDSLRRNLLAAAAALVVVSFTWFQPTSSASQLASDAAPRRSIWFALRDRYIRRN